MFIASVKVTNGSVFYLASYGWASERDDWRIRKFITKRDAYNAYQRAFKRKGDVYQAIKVQAA